MAKPSGEVLLQSATDAFEFSQEDEGEELLPERIDFDAIPVDPYQPGFASLLPALQGFAEGQFGPQILDAYLVGLAPRLEEARSQLMHLEIPPAVRDQVAPALAATQMVLEELGVVLDLVDQHLVQGDEDALFEAIDRLSRVHSELKHAL